MPLIVGGIGLGAGVLKDIFVDKPAADRARVLAAKTQEFSPWTHLTATAPQTPSALNAGMSGALAGASFGQGLQNASAQNALLKSMAAGTATPGSGGGGGSNPWQVANFQYPTAPQLAGNQ